MDDVPSLVVGDDRWKVLGHSGACRQVRHHTTQQVVAADDEPQLLAGVKCQPDGEHVNIDRDDLTGLEFFSAVKAVSGYDIRRCRLVQTPHGNCRRPLEPLYLRIAAPSRVRFSRASP